MIPGATFTPETSARAAEARRRAIAESPYRRDWLDSSLWDELAKTRGLRLPQWHTPPTPRKLIQALGILRKGEKFKDVYGCSPAQSIARNPTMPLRAFIGQMLEDAV